MSSKGNQYKSIMRHISAKQKVRCVRTDKTGADIRNTDIKTICWECANSCGRCSWSASFIPIEGWEAIETEYEGVKYCTSYTVLKCPKYEPEQPKKTNYPKIPDSELPYIDDLQKRVMYCVTDDVYFRTYMDCARYIESKGGYKSGINIYWIITDRKARGMQSITIGNRVYKFIKPTETN